MDSKDNTIKKGYYEEYKDILLKDGRSGAIAERFRTDEGYRYAVDTETLDGKEWTMIFVNQDEIAGYKYPQ